MESKSDHDKKGRYDLSMSRRTRKPAVIAAITSPDPNREQRTDGDDTRHPSLEDLLKEVWGEEGVGFAANAAEGKGDREAGTGDEENPRVLPADGGSLPRHKLVQEGKHLQLVRVHGGDGVKLSGMVTRCVKVLNTLVKNRPGAKKMTVARLLK